MGWYILFAVVVLVVIAKIWQGDSTETPLERKEHGGVAPIDGDIDALLINGRKIEAIKAYRAIHQVDLKAAKDAVETRARKLLPRV